MGCRCPPARLGLEYAVAAQGAEGAEGAPLQVVEEGMADFLSDFRSRVWVTYRTEFPPLGDSGLTSDVGWGCTLRSGQMLLAQVLLRHFLGRAWRAGREEAAAKPARMSAAKVVRLFWDEPTDAAPFSIHNICSAGAKQGIVAGEWLGPYVVCKALAALVNATACAGLTVAVVSEPGGGAPTLYSGEQGTGEGGFPRLLLVPLTLGVGKMNPVYHAQLKEVFQLPQSAGIVGGRPGSSLFFVGYQDEYVVYLDPHFARPAPRTGADLGTYHCDTVRHMAIGAMDPSLAIGFYCATAEDFSDLCERLALLEGRHKSAPLITVRGGEAAASASQDSSAWLEEQCASPCAEGDGDAEAWELL